MTRASNADKANIELLQALISQHGTALAAEQALYQQLEHLPARLSGMRLRELRASLHTEAGIQASQANPELATLLGLFYQRMLPPVRLR